MQLSARLSIRAIVVSLCLFLCAACMPPGPLAKDMDGEMDEMLPTPHATLPPGNRSPMIHRLALGPANAYLIEAPEGLILVDTSLGIYADRIVRQIEALDKGPLCLIYITHAHLDHYAGANAIREATGAPVAVHEGDVAAMEAGESRLGTVRNWRWTEAWLPHIERLVQVDPTPVDIVLRDGDAVTQCGLDGTSIWTPGHTPGSSSLLVQMDDASHIFVGDLIANSNDPRIQRTYAQDWQKLLPSVLKTLSFAPDFYHLGHGAEPLTLQQVIEMEIRGPAAGAAP